MINQKYLQQLLKDEGPEELVEKSSKAWTTVATHEELYQLIISQIVEYTNNPTQLSINKHIIYRTGISYSEDLETHHRIQIDDIIFLIHNETYMFFEAQNDIDQFIEQLNEFTAIDTVKEELLNPVYVTFDPYTSHIILE